MMLRRVRPALVTALALAVTGALPPVHAQESTQAFMVRAYPEAPSMAEAEAAAKETALKKVLQRLAANTWSKGCREQVVAQKDSFLEIIGKRQTAPDSSGTYKPVIGIKAMPAKAQQINESCNTGQVADLGKPQVAVALTLCYQRDDGPCEKTADTARWETSLNRAVERVLRQNGFELPQLPPKFEKRLHYARGMGDLWQVVQGEVQFALIGRAVVDETRMRERKAAAGKVIPVTINARFLNLNASSGGAVPVHGEETGTGDSLEAAITDAMPAIAGDTVRTVAVNDVIAAWKAQAERGIPVDVAVQIFDRKGVTEEIRADLAKIAEARGCTTDDKAQVGCYRIRGENVLTDPVSYLEKAANGTEVCRISRNRRRYYVYTDKPGRVCTGAGDYEPVPAGYGDVRMRFCSLDDARWPDGAARALAAYPDIGDCAAGSDSPDTGRCFKITNLEDGVDPRKVINHALRMGRERGRFEPQLRAAYMPDSREARMKMVVGHRETCFD